MFSFENMGHKMFPHLLDLREKSRTWNRLLAILLVEIYPWDIWELNMFC
jgi:hypothetical protein